MTGDLKVFSYFMGGVDESKMTEDRLFQDVMSKYSKRRTYEPYPDETESVIYVWVGYYKVMISLIIDENICYP